MIHINSGLIYMLRVIASYEMLMQTIHIMNVKTLIMLSKDQPCT